MLKALLTDVTQPETSEAISPYVDVFDLRPAIGSTHRTTPVEEEKPDHLSLGRQLFGLPEATRFRTLSEKIRSRYACIPNEMQRGIF